MSTIVATKKALVSALSRRPALDGVRITYAEDVRSPRKERICMGDVEDHSAAPATMRNSKVRTQEEYALRLLIDVQKKGVEAAETRIIEILGQVELLLAEDPKLSTAETPPGIQWATFGGFRMDSTLTSEGEATAALEATVNVTARNT